MIALLRHDRVGLTLVIAILVGTLGLAYPGGYPLAYALAGLSVLVTLWLLLRGDRLLPRGEWPLLLPVLGVVLLALAYAITATGLADIRFALNFTMLLLLAPLTAAMTQFASPRNTRRVANLALLGVIIATAIAAYQTGILGRGRADGFGSDEIWSAQTAVILGFVAAIGFIAVSGWRRWLYLLGPMLGTLVSILAGSRGPLIAVPVLAIVLVVFASRRWYVGILAVLAAAALTLGIVALLWPVELARLGSIGTIGTELLSGSSVTEVSSSVRLLFYTSGFAAFLDAPLFGYGWGHRLAAAYAHMPDGGTLFLDPASIHFTTHHLHSDMIDLAVAAGSVGLLVYALFIATPLLAAWRSPPDGQYRSRRLGTLLTTLAYLICGLTYLMLGYEYHTTLFTCLTAILVGYCRDRPPLHRDTTTVESPPSPV